MVVGQSVRDEVAVAKHDFDEKLCNTAEMKHALEEWRRITVETVLPLFTVPEAILAAVTAMISELDAELSSTNDEKQLQISKLFDKNAMRACNLDELSILRCKKFTRRANFVAGFMLAMSIDGTEAAYFCPKCGWVLGEPESLHAADNSRKYSCVVCSAALASTRPPLSRTS